MTGTLRRACAAAIVAMCVVALGAGIAAGRPRPKPYTPHGSSDLFAVNGQVCISADFAGHGGWTTNYHETYVSTDNQPGTIDDKSSASFSWQVEQHGIDADCALTLLRGVQTHGGGTVFNGGFTRYSENVNDVNTPALPPPVTYSCSKGIIAHASSGSADSMLKITRQGASLVFTATVELPSAPCGGENSEAGTPVVGGKIGGDWFTASSAKVPISLLEHVKSMTVSVASASNNGGLPNCGVSSSNVKCSQTGAWQGTITLKASE
jgi:hypothetical protein